MKKLFLSIFIFIYSISFAQESQRVDIRGNIKVPEGAEAEGITIYNRSTHQGTVSSKAGDFVIAGKAGDTLYFSAIQFQGLSLVLDEATVENQVLNVAISEGVNELPEVVIRPYDITGNPRVDTKTIKTVPIPLPPSGGVLNEYDFEMRPDSKSPVHNAAMGPGTRYAFNPLGLIVKVVSLIVPKKKSKPKPPPELTLIELDKKLRATYDTGFFTGTLGIPQEQISDFIAYMEGEDFPQELLEKGKAMDLIQYLLDQSAQFRKQDQ